MVHLVTNSLTIEDNVKPLSVLINWLKTKRSVQVDTETEGWFDFKNKILTLQIGDKDDQFVIDCTTVDIRPLKPFFASKEIEKVFWNAIFDLKFLYLNGFEVENIYDGFLAECLLSAGRDTPKGYLSLNSASQRYVKLQLDKEARGLITSEGLTQRVINYAANDVKYLHDIQAAQIQFINKHHLNDVLDLENEVCLAFAEIEFNGMGFDPNYWSKIATYTLDRLREIENKLNDIVLSKPNPFISHTLFGEISTLNWRSPTQIKQFLKNLNIDIPDTQDVTLKRNSYKHPLFPLLLNHREEAKRVSTYGPTFLRYINPTTKRIHTSFFQILKTGRISSGSSDLNGGQESPNMQNIPANNVYRNAFVPGIKDFLFVSADYSSQELALIAEDAGEEIWIEAVNNDWDLHSMIAAKIFSDWDDVALQDCAFKLEKKQCKCPEHKSYRTITKTFNYALAYGAKPPKIADTLQVSVSEAIRLQNMYFSVLPKLHAYFNKIQKFALDHLRINTMSPFRRIRFFEDPNEMPDDLASSYIASIKRWSVNTRIQGTGADICKNALTKVRRYIVDNNLRHKVKLVMQVHDQIDTIAHKDFAQEWAIILKRLMEQASAEVTKKVKIKVDVKITEKWEK